VVYQKYLNSIMELKIWQLLIYRSKLTNKNN